MRASAPSPGVSPMTSGVPNQARCMPSELRSPLRLTRIGMPLEKFEMPGHLPAVQEALQEAVARSW